MNFEGYAFQHTSSLEIPCWIFEIRTLKDTLPNIRRGNK
jgi:hypothetical protein